MKKHVLSNFLVVLLIMTALVSDAQTSQQKIQITDIHVEKNQNKVEIEWRTDAKFAANYFEVEQSKDGKEFKTVGYILGPDPAKTNCDCYGFYEKIPTGMNGAYYRLKHINTNGQVELSEVKSVALK